MSLIRPCLVVGAVVLGSSTTWAQSQDSVKWRANAGITSNNNFFSTPTAPVSERVTSETLGLNLSLPYSLQRFELDASVVANQHQTNSNFDYTGTNFNATWLWSVTPQLRGTLNSTRTETLNAAADSVDPTQRNRSAVHNTALAGAYDLGGPWQLTAGLVNNNTVNERAVTGQTDNHATGVNAGLRYALGSGNVLAYFHQIAKGDSNSRYTLTTDDATLVWVLSGNTTLNGHLAFLQQQFESTPVFDFSGTAGGVNLVWRLSGKTSVTTGWQRELVSFQTNGSSYTQTDTLSVTPVWQISPITSVRMLYRTGTVSEQGNPFGTPSSRQDRVQDTSLSFNWQPYQQLNLTATVEEVSRRSDDALKEFKASLITLLAVFSF